jgi:mannan endo-1,4-beta-mannosidase
MDVYVREFGLKDHDEFYKNPSLVDAFKNYTSQVVKRYVNKPSLFGWELANDPRCNSTLPAGGCTPKDVTRWHADIADHIRTIDTNHLISSG